MTDPVRNRQICEAARRREQYTGICPQCGETFYKDGHAAYHAKRKAKAGGIPCCSVRCGKLHDWRARSFIGIIENATPSGTPQGAGNPAKEVIP